MSEQAEDKRGRCWSCGNEAIHATTCCLKGLVQPHDRVVPLRSLTEAEAERDAAEIRATEAEQKLAAWHEAMTDVSVINWTLSEANAGQLHAQLMDVIAQTVQEAIDPRVSQQAADLKAAEIRATNANTRADGLQTQLTTAIQERDAANARIRKLTDVVKSRCSWCVAGHPVQSFELVGFHRVPCDFSPCNREKLQQDEHFHSEACRLTAAERAILNRSSAEGEASAGG